ncbi:MAG: GNAT family N-acetyltransferase [Frankiales bacterium]|nr:GNAT family N-acetyltransferase [Frankiales bacterium]
MTGPALRRAADATSLRKWQAVGAVSDAHDHVGLPADPVESLLPFLDGPVSGEVVEFWALLADGEAVATADIHLPQHDNLTGAEVDARVLPTFRGHGFGRVLAQHVVDRVGELGRSRLFFETFGRTEPSDPSGAGAGLARSFGARPVLTEIRRVLSVADVPDDDVGRLQEQAAADAVGYSLEQWVGRSDPAMYDDLAALMARMSTDPPSGEREWEPERWDADRYAEKERAIEQRGQIRVATAVRHDASGRIVGFTELGTDPRQPTVAFQWDTIVAPEHRGHRLGLLVKAANHLQLRAAVPTVAHVSTWNAEANTHMIAINEAMGFRVIDRWWHWQLDVG